MRFLLVQVPTSHLGAGERVYPLGLARLSSLISGDHDKFVLDMNLSPDPWRDLKEMLESVRPDTVLLSFRNIDPLAGQQTSYLASLSTSARMARLLVPGARIWAGGPAFSLFPGRLMAEVPEIDMGLVGEGELAFPQMIAAGGAPARVPGTVVRDGGRIRRNPAGARADMNALPPLDTAAFSPAAYLEGNRYVAVMGIEGKRGCDLTCGYCIYPCLGGGKLRLRDPDRIVDEMAVLHRDFGVGWFHFTDGVVNRPADHFEAVCRAMIRRKLRVQWTGFFREDTLTDAQLALAAAAGLGAVYFSGDGLTDHGRGLLKKRLDREDLLRAARITAAHGVLTMCHFLINLPDELPDHEVEARETLDRILDIHGPAGNLGAIIFNTVRLYPDAPLTRRLVREQRLDPRADLLYPVYYNPLPTAHLLHDLSVRCQTAGVFSHLSINDTLETS